MYTANARNMCLGSIVAYIPPTCIGVCVGGNANFSIFSYQYVGIPNAGLGSRDQREDPTQEFCVAVDYRLIHCFTRVFLGIKNVSENARKSLEKRKKITQRENIFLYYTMCWVKLRARCVCSRVLAHVWSHKPYQNTNPTHSVIWALM